MIFTDLCDDSPCANNGICIRLDEGFACVCEIGFHGELCEEGIADHFILTQARQ